LFRSGTAGGENHNAGSVEMSSADVSGTKQVAPGGVCLRRENEAGSAICRCRGNGMPEEMDDVEGTSLPEKGFPCRFTSVQRQTFRVEGRHPAHLLFGTAERGKLRPPTPVHIWIAHDQSVPDRAVRKLAI